MTLTITGSNFETEKYFDKAFNGLTYKELETAVDCIDRMDCIDTYKIYIDNKVSWAGSGINASADLGAILSGNC